MKIFVTAAAALVLLLATSGSRADEGPGAQSPPLTLRAKIAAATSTPPPSARAPFIPVPGELHLDLIPHDEDARLKASRSSCQDPGRSLCYDQGTNKIVYKGTRAYMPDIPGLRAEHISVRRDRITFKYSFQ